MLEVKLWYMFICTIQLSMLQDNVVEANLRITKIQMTCHLGDFLPLYKIVFPRQHPRLLKMWNLVNCADLLALVPYKMGCSQLTLAVLESLRASAADHQPASEWELFLLEYSWPTSTVAVLLQVEEQNEFS